MKTNPLVSIVVPVYNIKKYLGQCIDSLLSQDYSDIEIIIVDDASTDGSAKLCDFYDKQDQRIKVHHRAKNQGLSAARNYGIKQAKGEYVALVDGDDTVEPYFISCLLERILAGQADIAVCGFDKISPAKTTQYIPDNATTIDGESAAIELLTKQQDIDVVAWNKLYRKELFSKIQYPVGETHEDNLTTYKLYAAAKKVTYSTCAGYNYYVREGSIMSKGNHLHRLKVKERAAREAIEYFTGQDQLQQAAQFSLLLAKFAMLDATLKEEVGDASKNASERTKAINWLQSHAAEYTDNQFLSSKSQIYLRLIKTKDGAAYRLFRKVKH